MSTGNSANYSEGEIMPKKRRSTGVKRLSKAELKAELEEQMRHRYAMFQAARHGVASFYRNPEAAVHLIDEYIVKSMNQAMARDSIVEQLGHEIKSYRARMLRGLPLRHQRLSLLEQVLFPRATPEKGKVPEGYYMDRRYHGSGLGW